MIQYAVNSTAYLLKNIPIDRGYEHSYRFTSPTEQNEWMLGANHAPVRFENLTYIREHNSILLEGSPEDYMDYNYIAYVNESYDPSTVYSSGDMRYTESANPRRRWIYGFISSVQYYSNNVVEIFFAVDVLQTFYFDFEFGKCFVEREHSASDEIGENIVPEPVSYEDYQCVQEKMVGTKEVARDENHKAKWLACIALARPILGETYRGITSKVTRIHITPGDFDLFIAAPTADFGPGDYAIGRTDASKPIGGVPTSIYWYMDIPIYTTNPNEFRESGTDLSIVPPKATEYAFNNNIYTLIYDATTLTYEAHGIDKMGVMDLVTWITRGFVPTREAVGVEARQYLNEKDICAVAMYPAEYSALGNEYSTLNERGLRSKFVPFNPVNYFMSNVDSSHYVPTNNKLFTYPYRYIEASSNIGGVNKYKFEDFVRKVTVDGKTSFGGSFAYIMSISANPTAMLVPTNHQRKEEDYDSALVVGDAPQPTYPGDAFGEYITQNRNKLTSSVLQTAASLAGSAFGAHSVTTYSGESTVDSISVRNPSTGKMQMTDKHAIYTAPHSTETQSTPGASPYVNTFNKIAGMVGQISDIRATPPSIYGNASITDMRIGTDRLGVVIREMGVNAVYAKIIDQFFTMFGYATNAVKKPGIYNRYRYQYIKLGQAVIHPNSYALIRNRTGMNAEVEERLSAIFSKGITLWNKDFDIGDYPDGEANPVCTGVVVAEKQSTSNEVRDHFDVTIGYGGRTITLPGSDAAITVDRQYLNPGSTPTIVHISINGYTIEQTFN